MARSMRFALLLLPLLITTACRFVDQQKDLVARIAAFSVLRPVLEMQSTRATLTQGSIRNTDAVAAKRTPKPAAPIVAAVPARAGQPAVRIVNVESTRPLVANAAAKPTIVWPRQMVHVRIDGQALHTIALAQARAHLAVAQCQVEAQRLQTRKRRIMVTPGGEFELPPASGRGGQGLATFSLWETVTRSAG
jgi:hypothetical protein